MSIKKWLFLYTTKAEITSPDAPIVTETSKMKQRGA
jgi:hypothetical protein